MVTTSCAEMLFVGAFRPYLLKELDNSSAVTLLQLRSIKPHYYSDEGKVIAELVENNPLALEIVAELIRRPPHVIIDELRKHLIPTLNLTVLKLSYNY